MIYIIIIACLKPILKSVNNVNFQQTVINNYWTRLSKISWFVCGKQINYLPKLKAEANNWYARHWYFAITEFNNCFIIRSPSLSFKWISSGSEAICHFHARVIARRRKARFPLRMCRILFEAKHSWKALRMSRPLFVGSYLQVTWLALGQWKERKICFEW